MNSPIPGVQQETNQKIQQFTQPPINNSPVSVNRILLIIVSTILLIMLVGGAYLLGTKNNQQSSGQVVQQGQTQETKPTPTPLSSKVLTKEGDPTANWKTYKNAFGQFSLKIPQDWIIKPVFVVTEAQQSQMLQSADYAERPQTTPGISITDIASGVSLSISIEKNPNFSSFDALKNFEQKESTEFSLTNFDRQEAIPVDGQTAMLVSNSKTRTLPHIKAAVYSYKNGFIYKLTFNNTTGDISQFNQILSTFKFTN